MKTNWLKEHIVELLAVIAVMQSIIVMLWVLFHEVKSTDSTTLMILSQSGNIAMLVLAFYFGSSKSSKDKQAILDKKDEAQ